MQFVRVCLWAGVFLFASGCASVPRDRGAGEVNRLLQSRGTPAAQWPESESRQSPPAAPGKVLTLRQSLELAFSRSPVVREQYAELGLGAADAYDATKLPDLGLEYSRLSFSDGHSQVTKGMSLALADVLLVPGRMKMSSQAQQAVRLRVAARLSQLESDVAHAWFEHTAALQAGELRDRAARLARLSADYATRLHKAGNLPPRALAQELAAASNAEITAARARVHALATRAQFATVVGLSIRDGWRLAPELPALPAPERIPPALADDALRSRPDLEAARHDLRAEEITWRAARFWRWMGVIEVGYEREKEHNDILKGPTFRFGLPLFHWNRGGVLRARAGLEAARSRLDALELAVLNEVSLGLDRLTTTRRIAEIYRDTLVPQREQVSARTLEEVNFMLAGAFEALAARREQFEAYQEYIDAVRDVWLARVELRLASGGNLPVVEPADTLKTELPASEAVQEHGAHP
jgi:cobalt-zinc-cadmium efflux system outer membrane protein